MSVFFWQNLEKNYIGIFLPDQISLNVSIEG